MLSLYRDVVRIRRTEPGLGDGPMGWLPSADGVLAFSRGDRFVNVTNLSGAPAALPAYERVLLATAEIVDGHLPPDASAWLRPIPSAGTHPRVPIEEPA